MLDDSIPPQSHDSDGGTPAPRKRRKPSGPASQPTTSGPPLGVIPPQSQANEMCLLGAMILDRDQIGEVLDVVDTPECFYSPQHRTLYEALKELYRDNQPLDLVILYDHLKHKKLLEAVGGADYLSRLVASVPDAQNAIGYARIVKEKSLLRSLIVTANTIIHEAYVSPLPAAEVLDQAERQMFEVTHRRQVGQATAFSDLMNRLFEDLDRGSFAAGNGILTGFTELDNKLCGLQQGEMIVVAARPSMGKTAFALNMADHIAVNERKRVAIFSMEMSKAACTMRLLCTRARVNSQVLRNQEGVGQHDHKRLVEAANDLQNALIYIDDTVALTPMALRARARRLKQHHKIDVIFVDYLQLMRDPTAESRQVEITHISSACKQIARELDIPVVALAQLNRGVESREGHKPRMSDLRESGSIEQDADVVLLLHRESYYNRDDPSLQGKAEVIVAKQRNGPTGEVPLQFTPELARFANLHEGLADDYG